MSLEQKIAEDLKAAMKAKDDAAKRGIRAIKSAILLAKTDGTGEAFTEEKGIKMLQKLVKQRKDSIAIYEEQGRADLAEKEKEEVAVIEKYLPAQLDPATLKTELQKIIAEVGASSIKDMGKVIGAAQKKLAGQAEGKAIASTVKELLG